MSGNEPSDAIRAVNALLTQVCFFFFFLAAGFTLVSAACDQIIVCIYNNYLYIIIA